MSEKRKMRGAGRRSKQQEMKENNNLKKNNMDEMKSERDREVNEIDGVKSFNVTDEKNIVTFWFYFFYNLIIFL